MLKNLFGNSKSLAIDIGTNAIKIVELQLINEKIKLTNFEIAYLPPDIIVDAIITNPEYVEDCIKKILYKLKIKTKNVIIGISGKLIIVKTIRLLRRSYEDLKKTIIWEAEQYIPFNINEIVIDFQILPDSEEEKESKEMNVLLVAAKKDGVEKYINLLKKIRLNPIIIDVDSFAVANAYEKNTNNLSDVVSLINIGATIMNITILENNRLQFTRDVSIGGYSFTKSIQNQMKLDYRSAEEKKKEMEIDKIDISIADEMLMEIQRSFSYYKSTIADVDVNKIVLSGGCANLKGIDTYFNKKLSLPVEIINPINKIQVNLEKFNIQYLRAIAPMLTVSIGLAIRGLTNND